MPPGPGSAPTTRASRCSTRRPARRSRGSRAGAGHGARWSGTPARSVARRCGQLTFHQRAGLLKALAKDLNEHKDELYALSLRTGATQKDGAGRHRRRHRRRCSATPARASASCPTTRSSSTAALEPLGQGGTFVGQHVYTSLPGVAVQINAFNFPVWGMLEKLAPAFLAGRAVDREAGVPDGVPDRGRRTADRGVGHPARGLAAAAVRQRGEPARRARLSRTRWLSPGSAPTAARAPHPRVRPARRSRAQRRGRLAQLLDPRAGRDRRRPGVRALRQAASSPR